jgi:3-phenylpropionate/cinnamic acid dioxygenase small subunit
MTALITPQATGLRSRVEDFLYAEATLLDEWRLDDWLRPASRS